MNFGAIFSSGWLAKLSSIFGKTTYRTKILSTDVTADGVIAELTFPIEIGKSYRVCGQAAFEVLLAGQDIIWMNIDDGAQVVASPSGTSELGGKATPGINAIFVATTTSLTCSASSASPTTSRIEGNGSRSQTFIQLEELPNHEEV